jgi:hypothetical protein
MENEKIELTNEEQKLILYGLAKLEAMGVGWRKDELQSLKAKFKPIEEKDINDANLIKEVYEKLQSLKRIDIYRICDVWETQGFDVYFGTSKPNDCDQIQDEDFLEPLTALVMLAEAITRYSRYDIVEGIRNNMEANY